ncbi:MAG: hypothetical protein V4451_16995 [Pseudomonadota bacterium]
MKDIKDKPATPAPAKGLGRLTKAETVALWHAVDFLALGLREAATLENINQAGLQVERDRLETAKRALRKVNALRKKGL